MSKKLEIEIYGENDEDLKKQLSNVVNEIESLGFKESVFKPIPPSKPSYSYIVYEDL